MFDILTDVWKHPGAVHSPIVPMEISGMTAESIESRISELHKYGLDAILLLCDGGSLADGAVEAALSAAKKRFMPVFVSENVISADTGCTEDVFVSYNPMLARHTLRLAGVVECELEPCEEIIHKYYLRFKDGVLCDTAETLPGEDDEAWLKYNLILTEKSDGVDRLSFETGEMFVSVYDRFLEKYKSYAGSSFAGVYTSALTTVTTDSLPWSYELSSEFFSLGATPQMLLSLLCETDKRSRKEGARLYSKTVGARVAEAYLEPLSRWCGANSLAFMGEVPYEFIGSCTSAFTLPVYADRSFDGAVTTDGERMSAVKYLSDVARGEGFTGAVYTVSATAMGEVKREICMASAAGAAMFMLDAVYSDPSFIESSDIRREDMKKLSMSFRRLSTLGTSCTPDSSCLVLCDDGFIPFSGADKLRELGVQFNFTSVSQGLEKGRSHDGEFLIDKFRYSAMLVDQRVRLDSESVRHFGEFAAYGGKFYRGGQFGDFAKKHLGVNEFGKACAKSLLVYSTVKCAHRFELYVNVSDETYTLRRPFLSCGRAYILDPDLGNKRELCCRIPAEEYEAIRLMPGEFAVLAWDTDALPTLEVKDESVLREIHALKRGENKLFFCFADGDRAVFEADGLDGRALDITVNGTDIVRILAKPYTVDLTKAVCDGENVVSLVASDPVHGAVLRLYRKEG